MKLAVIHAIACTVVARGSADRDSQGSRILACSIERHHGLLSPLIFRSSPADRDHRGIICGVMNRGGEGIEKTLVGVRCEIHRDTRARRHGARDLNVERYLPVRLVGITCWRIHPAIHRHGTHLRYRDAKAGKESVQIVGVVPAAKLENADTLARTLSTGGKILDLRNLRRCIRGCCDVRLQSARSVFFEPEMRRGLRTIVQPENTFDDFRKISRDPQVPSPPAVLAARMPVEAEFDFKSTAECTHWPGKDARAPRNAFTFYSQAFRLREGTDTREVLGEGAVRLRKFLTS